MQTLSQFQSAFQKYVTANSFDFTPQELYEPVDYILGLGGKKIRPVLLLMSYALYKEDISPALPAAYAVEIFHNFSLLHDDIMDKAPLRRGKPTVHEKYNINTGILSGDVMLIYAYEYLLQLPAEMQPLSLLQIFNQVAREVCEGQQMDMNFEVRDDVSIEEYLKMIELKTAVLLGGAMRMGAIAAEASIEDAEHLAEFGKNVGIAFQLQDDILDTFGDPTKFGKKVGGDIAQNKKTFLYLKALEVASNKDKEHIVKLFSSTPTDEVSKINTVTNIFRTLNIQKLSEEVKNTYQQKAFEHLAKVQIPANRKTVLMDLAEQLLGREA